MIRPCGWISNTDSSEGASYAFVGQATEAEPQKLSGGVRRGVSAEKLKPTCTGAPGRSSELHSQNPLGMPWVGKTHPEKTRRIYIYVLRVSNLGLNFCVAK